MCLCLIYFFPRLVLGTPFRSSASLFFFFICFPAFLPRRRFVANLLTSKVILFLTDRFLYGSDLPSFFPPTTTAAPPFFPCPDPLDDFFSFPSTRLWLIGFLVGRTISLPFPSLCSSFLPFLLPPFYPRSQPRPGANPHPLAVVLALYLLALCGGYFTNYPGVDVPCILYGFLSGIIFSP